MLSRMLRSTVVGVAAMLFLVFAPAGTFAWPQGWAFVAAFLGGSTAFALDLARRDPELLRRRMQAGARYEREPAQKVIMRLISAAFALLIGIPALDHRFGWSALPWPVSVAGDVLIVLAFAMFHLVARVNSYAASNVRVEAGQTVASTGVYGVVRHPMYSGALLLVVGTPLALGSLWGLLVAPAFLPILAWRLLNEETVLARELKGYGDYMKTVRWRLVPGVW